MRRGVNTCSVPGPGRRWRRPLLVGLGVGLAHAGLLGLLLLQALPRAAPVQTGVVEARLIVSRPQAPVAAVPKAIPPSPPKAARARAPSRPRKREPAAPGVIPLLSPPLTAVSAEPVPSVAPATAPAPTPQASPASVAPAPLVAPVFNADYLDNPPPRYPPMSRRLGETGRVLLRVLVSVSGHAEQVELMQSSGFARLDAAARQAVLRWRFVPARRGDERVAAWVLVPVSFVM